MRRLMIKPYIAARVVQELRNGDVVNLGTGLPTFIPNYFLQGVQIVLQSENGIVSTGKNPGDPIRVTDVGGMPVLAASDGSYIDSAVPSGLIRDGHAGYTVLGTLEVDARGNLISWTIPNEKVPGMGGAMDLVIGAKKVIVAMEYTTRGKHKILTVYALPYTAVNCASLIVTEMCVLQVADEELAPTGYNPEFMLGDTGAATETEFIVSNRPRPMEVRIARVS